MDTNSLTQKASLLILIMSLIGTLAVGAQNRTKLNILMGVADQTLKTRIETNASAVLTEINNAFAEKRKLKDSPLTGLSEEGREIILAMWETSHFRCPETLIQENALRNINGGYEIRNIPVIVKEADPKHQYQEIAMIFDGGGNLDEIYYTLEMNQYLQLKSADDTVADYRRRQVIIDFMEKFRTAYNRKDLDLISKVYSDDALIIVGRVIQQQESGADSESLTGIAKGRVEFIRLSKENYIRNLKACFARNQYVNIRFSGIELVKHSQYPEIYGVTLKQDWSSSKYSDVGYLFLMIDFRDEDNPLIKVRTWEPEKDADGKIVTTEANRLQIGNFDIIR